MWEDSLALSMLDGSRDHDGHARIGSRTAQRSDELTTGDKLLENSYP